MIVVGEAANGREAIALTRSVAPDVVIMDLTMPDVDGMAATKAILASHPSVRVVVLSMHEESRDVAAALAGGAAAFVAKSAADCDLIDAVRSVVYGDGSARPVFVDSTNPSGVRIAPTERDRYQLLTTRERDVLQRIALGFSGPEIGAQLGISSKTVDTYKHRIQRKIDLDSRSDYVRFALKAGLFGLDGA